MPDKSGKRISKPRITGLISGSANVVGINHRLNIAYGLSTEIDKISYIKLPAERLIDRYIYACYKSGC